MAARTAIVVVAYRSHELLARHLARTADASTTVVVVDQFADLAERAAVSELAARSGWELVGLDDNRGFGAGVNAGARRAAELGCDVLVLLNPDLDVEPGTVAELARSARSDRALVSPLVVRPDGRPWFRGGTLDLATGHVSAAGGGELRWLSGACLAMSTALWQEVGGFDEDYFLYWEDVDLSWRVRAAGGRLVLRADLLATHTVGGTQQTSDPRAKSLLYYRHVCRGRLLFAARHLDRATAWRWVARAPRHAVEVVLRGGRRQLLRSPAPVLAAIAGTVAGVVAVVAGSRTTQAAAPRLLVAHPSPDLYGSDRQLLETTGAALGAGWQVEVAVPHDGPLVALLREQGARVLVAPFPVLRKSLLHPVRLPGLVVDSLRTVRRVRALLRDRPPTVLYVNTVTIPVWLVAGRLSGVRTICHVHEAEEGGPRLLSAALNAPLALADVVVANSRAARRVVAAALPSVGARVAVVHNGVPGPPSAVPAVHEPGGPWRLAMVGRLSPRKGVDVALEAVALLAAQGREVRLSVCGTIFPGYEWYEQELRERAARPDLAGRVELLGYVHPTWPVLEAADVVLVPSRVEPFGNTAVEALLARRPVVASATQGLVEVVVDGVTGLLVPPGDPGALAAAVGAVLDDDALRERLAAAGVADAGRRFTTGRYRRDILVQLDRAARRPVGHGR